MAIKILKKIGMGLIYYLIGTLFSTVFDMFGITLGRSYFSAFIHAVALGAIICAISRYLRIAKLKKEHKGDQSQEKVIFNGDLKAKVKYILGTVDFKIEAALCFIATFLIFVVRLLKLVAPLGYANVFSDPINILLLVAVMTVIPAFMLLVDMYAWVMAYNRCYKRREY